jgi:hypothetical protein
VRDRRACLHGLRTSVADGVSVVHGEVRRLFADARPHRDRWRERGGVDSVCERLLQLASTVDDGYLQFRRNTSRVGLGVTGASMAKRTPSIANRGRGPTVRRLLTIRTEVGLHIHFTIFFWLSTHGNRENNMESNKLQNHDNISSFLQLFFDCPFLLSYL